MIRRLIIKWLGLEGIRELSKKNDDRLNDIARHFVTKYDANKMPEESLADRYADQDGKPRPGPFMIHGKQWSTRRRMLEQQTAATPKRSS